MKPNILIIEDQADIRRLLRWSLEDSPYQLHEASSADAGLPMAQVLRPEVILLDWMLPGKMDGLQMCEALRADPGFAQTRILMLTARSQASDQARALAAGADEVLTKPFSPAALLAALERHLAAR